MKSVKILKGIPTDLETAPYDCYIRQWSDAIADAKSEDELNELIRACAYVNIVKDTGYVRRRTASTIAPLQPMSTIIAITEHDGQPVQSAGVYRGTVKGGSWLVVEDELGEIRALKATYTSIFEALGDA